jgi:hypothetical protein
VVRGAACGFVAGLVLIELTVRIATGSLFTWGSWNDRRYGVVDPVVGHVPRPGLSFRHPRKRFQISTGEHGTRRNGPAAPASERPLTVVVGDSFAFGDEVNDHEAWPAVLEQISGRRVINGGVPGFGVDQMALRAAQLTEAYHPDTLIMGFIPHDVRRCEMSIWSGDAKPYFELDGTGLRHHPAPAVSQSAAMTRLKRLLSHSVTLDILFTQRLHWSGPDTVVHRDGDEVACRLMDRFAQLGRAHGVRVVAVAYPQAPESAPRDQAVKDRVLACARRSGLVVLDMFPVFAELSPERRRELFHGHFSIKGNRRVAAALHDLLAATPPPGYR